MEFLKNWRTKNKDMFDGIKFVPLSTSFEAGNIVNLCAKLHKVSYTNQKAIFTVADGTTPTTGEIKNDFSLESETNNLWIVLI